MNQEIKQRLEMIQKGEVPEGYKMTKIGIIPNDWKVERLGKVLKIKHGKSQKEVEDENGLYPILGSGGIMSYANKYLYNKPSVLIGRKGTIDKPLYLEKPFWTVDTLFYSEIFEGNLAKFIFYKFKLINWRKYNEASGVPSLSASGIESLKNSFPSLQEQTSIAQILSNQDNLIELKEKLLEEKKKLKKSLMQNILTGKVRFKEFGDEWKEVRIGEIIKEFKKTNRLSSEGKNNGIYPFFNNSSKDFNKYLNEFDFDGELIITNTGGVAYFDYYNGKCATMSDCFVFTSNQNVKYLYLILKKIEKKINYIGFTGSGIKHLDKNYFKNIKILLPSLPEQEKIAKTLENQDKEIELLQEEIDQLKLQKKSLMQLLLTGIVRVPQSMISNQVTNCDLKMEVEQ
jgi:type I restriction enzyme, S subunit